MKTPASPTPARFLARRQPVQARSGTTVEAIFEATVQVLIAEGLARLTTTRVAERAGVSVGTLYQYFPNKQALQYALLTRHFEQLALAMEGVREASAGRPLAQLAQDLASAYVGVKMARPELTQALYQVAGALQQSKLSTGVHERLNRALHGCLDGVSDAGFSDIDRVAWTLLSAFAGLSRAAFEGDRPARLLQEDAAMLAIAYLSAAAEPSHVRQKPRHKK